MTTNDTTYRKEIVYSPDDHDFNAYLDGEYIGSFRNYHDAEVELDRLALELIRHEYGPKGAAKVAKKGAK